jgi:M6 family metalloprotease-like protein
MLYRIYRLTLLALLILGQFSGLGELFASIPPHPRVVKLLNEKKIPVPFYLQNRQTLLQRGLNAPWSSPRIQKQNLNNQLGLERSLGPLKSPSGTYKALVLIVKFSDKAQSVNPVSFDSLLFGNSMGAMRDYYKAISYNQIDIVTIHMPSSIGWLMAPQTYAYYVNSQQGFGTYPRNAQKLVEDVLAAADSSVDYSQYDNDLDGFVDALFVVHTGPGAEYTGNNNDIWSHAWTTYTPQVRDGVTLFHYSMEPEYWAAPGDMTCGVFAHELGHAGFGLPDLYDIDYSSEGLGNWSLMAGGSWNGATGLGSSPAFPDAWSQFQMGFLSPTNVTTVLPAQPINNSESISEAYRLWTTGSVEDQYFLVQNRQQIGYDTYLPGGGLLVFHVDESVTTDNQYEWYPGHTSSGHYLVALEQADGLFDLERNYNRGNSGDPYPGSSSNRNFHSTTVPNSTTYEGTSTSVSVKNISNSGLVMTADLEVGIVAGRPAISVTPDTMNMGMTAIGYVKYDTVRVRNGGSEPLIISGITSTLPDYSPSPTSFTLITGETQSVVIAFAPTDSILYNGVLTITSNDTLHSTFEVKLQGRGYYPPVITVSPDSFAVTLTTGDSLAATMTIGNTGTGVLNWNIKIRNQNLLQDLKEGTFWSQTKWTPWMNPPSYAVIAPKGSYRKQGETVQPTSSPASQLPKRAVADDTPLFGVSPIGISQLNPVTGAILKTLPLAISSGGPHGLCFDGMFVYFIDGYEMNKILKIDAALTSVVDTIATAFPSSIDGLGCDGRIIYALDYGSSKIYAVDLESETITATLNPGFTIGGGLSFGGSRGTLFVSNFSRFIYEINAVSGAVVDSFSTPLPVYGLAYSNSADVLFAGDYSGTTTILDPTTGSIIGSFTGGYDGLASDEALSMSLVVNPQNGSVIPGMNQDVTVRFSAKNLIGGDYRKIISIGSNDPVNNPKNVPANMHVIGKPVITVFPDTVNMGLVYLGANRSDIISVKNTGTDVLTISNISSSLSMFTVNPTNFCLAPAKEQLVTVTFTPADTLSRNGILSIVSDDSVHPTIDIVLQGQGVYPPVIAVSPSSLSADLITGESTTRTLTVSNTGSTDLRFDASIGFNGSASIRKSFASKSTGPSSYKGSIQPGVEYKPDQVIVKFKKGIYATQAASIRSSLKATVAKKFSFIEAELWNLSGVSVADAIARYKDDPLVHYIEPNYVVHAIDRTPNDPMFSQLWGMQKISAPKAWERTTGTSIVIGDIDTGIDTAHVDLAANLWKNSGEIPGNGIDDDGNGFIDDIHGWNFCNNTNNVYDNNGHGTHTAGTIAAIGNNGIGVAGVCWSAKIMPIKFLDAGGSGTDAGAISAIEYATKMHARLTSNSWGGGGFSQALYDAIKAAGDANALFVAAAGNSSSNTDLSANYPSGYDLDNIIAVASTTIDDGLSSFSNYGLVTVDLGAPGSDILSTLPANSYGTYSGTSMATPHVSGVAGLVLSLNPLMDWAEVKNIILSSTDSLPSLQGKTVTGGRLNAAHAVEKTQTWIKLNPLTAVVPPGNSLDVLATFDAARMNGGDYQSTIMINNNDPLRSVVEIPASLHVTGSPVLAVVPDTLKTGVVYIGVDHLDTLKVQNIGSDVLTITNITSNLPVFTTSTTNFSVSPGNEYLLAVRFTPIDSIFYNGVLTITSNDSLHPIIDIVMQGRGLYPPVMSVAPDSFAVTVASGDSLITSMTIGNTGSSVLNWNVSLEDMTQSMWRNEVARQVDASRLKVSAISLTSREANGVDESRNNQLAKSQMNDKIVQLAKKQSVNSLLNENLKSKISGNTIEDFETGVWPWSPWVNFGGGGTITGGAYEGARAILDPGWYYRTDITIGKPHENLSMWVKPGSGRFYLGFGATVTGAWSLVAGYNTNSLILQRNSVYDFADLASVPQNWVQGTWYKLEVTFQDGGIVAGKLYASDGVTLLNTVSTTIADFTPGGVAIRGFDGCAGDFITRNGGGSWLSLTPLDGAIDPGTAQIVDVKFNAKSLIGGDYNAKIVIKSNDPLNNQKNIPAHMKVVGRAAIAVEPDTLKVGIAYIGVGRVDTLTVKNVGSDILNVTNITSDLPVFTPNMTNFNVSPGEEQHLMVQFTPTDTIAYNGILTIASNDSLHPTISVGMQGLGSYPPSINVTPDSLSFVVQEKDSAEAQLMISNSGLGILRWSLNKLSDTGISAQRSLPATNSIAYNPDTKTMRSAVRSGVLTNSFADLSGKHIGILGSFNPSLIIVNDLTSRGARVSSVISPISNSVLDTLDIIAFDDQIGNLSAGDITTLRTWLQVGHGVLLEGDEAISNNNALIAGTNITEISTGTFTDGYFTNITPHQITEGVDTVVSLSYGSYCNATSPALILVRDNSARAHVVISHLGAGQVVVFCNELAIDDYILSQSNDTRILVNRSFDWLAGENDFVSIEPTYGIIAPGGSQTITVRANAQNVNPGFHKTTLALNNNDPLHNPKNVPISMQVIGKPVIKVVPDTLKSGIAYIGAGRVDTVKVKNIGSDNLNVTNITSSSTVFTVNINSFSVLPGREQLLEVSFIPTDTIAYNGSLTITSNDSLHPSVGIMMQGKGAYPPVISLSADSLAVMVTQGDSTQQTMKINNTGKSQLEFQLVNNYHTQSIQALSQPKAIVIEKPSANAGNSIESTEFPRTVVVYSVAPMPRILTIDAGVTENTGALDMLGYTYTKVTPSQFATQNLCNYDVLYVGWSFGSSGAALQALYDRRSDIQNFVMSGGGLVALSNVLGSPISWTWTPNSLGSQDLSTDMIHITNLSHPIMDSLSDALISNWSSSCHNEFISYDPSLEVLANTPSFSNLPVVLAGTLGAGRVVYTGLDPDFHYYYINSVGAGKLLRNMITWANRSSSWLSEQPMSGIVNPGMSADIDVRFTSRNMIPGTYSASLVINNNDPLHLSKSIPVRMTVTPRTSVTDEYQAIPKEYALHQNYPNPFNPSTTIQYALPVRSRVKLQIFNVLGQKVAELVSTEQNAGYQSIIWNANAATGIYFYRLEATGTNDPGKCFVNVKKMLFLK